MATHFRILAWRIHMDRGAWKAAVHGLTRSRTRLSNKALRCKEKRTMCTLHYMQRKDNRDSKGKKGQNTRETVKQLTENNKIEQTEKSEVGELLKDIKENDKAFTKIKTILEAISRIGDEKRASVDL